LLKLVLDGANLLILDEPTNHLDILAKETVEAALEVFDGTVLVVSHDRYLINEVASRIWEIEDHQIRDYKGNYEFYLEEKAKREETAGTVIRDAGKPWDGKVKRQPEKNKAVRRRSPAQLQELIEKVELRLREQEAMLGYLDRQISIPENHLDLEKSKAMAAEREEYVKTIDELVQKWEELLEEQELSNDA
jgi:ATP-binding cassette subfamily F protein 3